MTTHTDFASTATAPIHDPWIGTMARNAEAAVPAVQPVDNSVTPPSLALHARQVALPGAPIALVSVPGLPDVMRHAGPAPEVDRTLHPALPVSAVEHRPADAPLPGTVPATAHDPLRSALHLPNLATSILAQPTPVGFGAGLDAAQLATVADSRARLDRARAYAGRLASHMAEIRLKLDAAAGDDTAGPLRGELIDLDRKHRQAATVLAEVEAEHIRHEADLRALRGSDGEARHGLAEAHATRTLAQLEADEAKAILARAEAHAAAVDRKLGAARVAEARHDAEATERLHAALRDGTDTPATAEPVVRVSPGLEDDLRAAQAVVDRLKAEKHAKLDAVAKAERLVHGAADKVLTVEADKMAREVAAIDARASLLRSRIAAYAARTVGDHVAEPWTPPKNISHPGGWYIPEPGKPTSPLPPKKVATTPAITAVLPLMNSGAPASAEVAAWAAYAASLSTDPQAVAAFKDGPALPPSAPLPAARVA